ncbi:hypothetical protein, partial [Weissella sp. DD23]|uniref:hypothetical protein n=1 Tax=Weissella sp. DD23 TaxID=1777865 RepID=UPI001A9A493D
SGFVCVVLAHEAWVWGIGFDKDASWETPPVLVPAEFTQSNLWRSHAPTTMPRVLARHTLPNKHPQKKDHRNEYGGLN